MQSYTSFSKETWRAFRSDSRPGRIHMLNLIRLREWAEYSVGFDATGQGAYREYSRISAPVLTRFGGRIVWRGGFELMMVGPEEERWDICFIAEYPSVAAFIEMMRDPEYQKAMEHRQAAVEDSRLVRMQPQVPGDRFSGDAGT